MSNEQITEALNVIEAKPLLWFLFDQNNSGGEFVVNDDVCEMVYIQATSASEAISKAEAICDNSDSCPCCGDRWSFCVDDSEGTPIPMIYGTPIDCAEPMIFRKQARLHHIDGHIETVLLGVNRPIILAASEVYP